MSSQGDDQEQTNAFATAPNAETKTDDKYSQLVATNLLNLSSDDAVSNNVNTPETTAPMSLSNDSGVATTVGVASRSRSRTAKALSTLSSAKIDDIDDIAADNLKTAPTKVPAAAAAATVSLTTSASAVFASGGDNVAPEESTGVGTTGNTLAPEANPARAEVDGKLSTTPIVTTTDVSIAGISSSSATVQVNSDKMSASANTVQPFSFARGNRPVKISPEQTALSNSSGKVPLTIKRNPQLSGGVPGSASGSASGLVGALADATDDSVASPDTDGIQSREELDIASPDTDGIQSRQELDIAGAEFAPTTTTSNQATITDRILAQAIEFATEKMRIEMNERLQQLSNAHNSEMSAARAATAELAATANKMAMAALASQQERDKRDSEHEKTIDTLRSQNLHQSTLLDRELVISSSLQAQLEQRDFKSAASSMASVTSASLPAVEAAEQAASLEAQLQSFIAAEVRSSARAAAAANSEARAKLVKDTAAGLQRQKDSEEAAQQKMAQDQAAAFAKNAYEQQMREKAALEQEELIKQNRRLAIAKLEQDQRAAESELQSRYHREQAQLAATIQQRRADLGINTPGMTTGYSAAAASTPSSTSTAGASYSAAFVASSTLLPTPPAPSAPTPIASTTSVARTTSKMIFKLRAWSGAEQRTGFPAFLEELVNFIRKNHVQEPDCETWIDAYDLPAKLHPFAVNALLEKLRGVTWAMTKLKSLVKELKCATLELIPFAEMLKCIQGACLNTTVGLLKNGKVGAAVLLALSLTNARLSPSEHIENIDMLYQQAAQKNDAIMAELAHSTSDEHARAIKKYSAQLDWRAIARNLTNEFHRIEALKFCSATFNEAAATCRSAEDINALLQLAMEKASTFSDLAKPAPSVRSLDADDADAAHVATDADGFELEKRAKKKQQQAAQASASADAKKAKVALLCKSSQPWDVKERALVLSILGKDGTYSRQTQLCTSCNRKDCPKGTSCVTSKGYKRWLGESGNSSTGHSSTARASQRKPFEKRGKQPCFDFQQGRCTRGETCKYSHNKDSNSKTTGSGSSDSELERLRKDNANLTRGTHDLAQLLALSDSEFAKTAQAKLGTDLKERALSFVCSQMATTADDH